MRYIGMKLLKRKKMERDRLQIKIIR